MQIAIKRKQVRSLLGGLEFSSHLKLTVSKEELEQIRYYSTVPTLTFIGKEQSIYAGASLDALCKGVEIKHRDVHLLSAIEGRIIEDLVAIRRYVAAANAFHGSYEFEVPLDLNDLEVPEGFIVAPKQPRL